MKIRLRAAACHLALSTFIVAVTLSVIVGLWYPPPYFYLQGLSSIVLVLVSVDLVLGPLLTLIVFNPAKRTLKYDLAVIGLIQFCALGYGIYSTYVSRPVYVVFSDNRFNAVSPNEYLDTDVMKVSPDNPYLHFPITGPLWIGAVLPTNASPLEKEVVQVTNLVGGGLRIFPQFYVPYEKVQADASRAGKNAAELSLTVVKNPPVSTAAASPKKQKKEVTEKDVIAVKTWLTQLNLPLEKIVLVPLKGFANYGIVALHAETGAILGTLTQDPWWYE